jgi:DNA-binding CsgD family transcriptional regulator
VDQPNSLAHADEDVNPSVGPISLICLVSDRAVVTVAAGGRPRRLVLSGLDSLTSSERRTAQLAAVGLSNREIAQNLFVTARTVEGHLTHAYQKLAITSREQLPAALAPPDGGPTAPAPTSP